MSQPENHWHVDKRVSISHLITTLTMLVAVVAWSFQIQGRIDIAEVKIDANTEAIAAARADNAVQYKEIIRRLERLDVKLDNKQNRP